jgi:hypothetical protein
MVRSYEEGNAPGRCERREYRFTGKSMPELCRLCGVSPRKIIQYVATYNKRNRDKPALVGAALLQALLKAYSDNKILPPAAIAAKELELLKGIPKASPPRLHEAVCMAASSIRKAGFRIDGRPKRATDKALKAELNLLHHSIIKPLRKKRHQQDTDRPSHLSEVIGEAARAARDIHLPFPGVIPAAEAATAAPRATVVTTTGRKLRRRPLTIGGVTRGHYYHSSIGTTVYPRGPPRPEK